MKNILEILTILIILGVLLVGLTLSAGVAVGEETPEEMLYTMAQENHELAVMMTDMPPTYEKSLLRKTTVDIACGIYEVGQSYNDIYWKSYVKSQETLILLDTNCVVR